MLKIFEMSSHLQKSASIQPRTSPPKFGTGSVPITSTLPGFLVSKFTAQVSLSWITCSRATGLSPLAPGQWKGFLAAYGALYLSLGSLLRPLRIALSVTVTPAYTRFVGRIRDRLPFRTTRPALNRTLAIIVVALLLNFVGTCAIVFLGVSAICGLFVVVLAVWPAQRRIARMAGARRRRMMRYSDDRLKQILAGIRAIKLYG